MKPTQTLNKAQKFVRMVELMLRRGGIRASEAMEQFDLDNRTLRRYMADLRDLGLPIQDKGRGRNRMLVLDPAYGRQSVQLSLLEVVSLHFGRTLFDFLSGTHFAADMNDALERIAPIMDRSDADLTRDLDRKLMAVPEHAKDHAGSEDLIDEVLSALLYQNPATAKYARLQGPVRTYRLRPLTLGTYRQSLYLFALDEEEGKIKTFALDRFKAFKRKRKEHFDYPADYDPKALIAESFGITGGPVMDVAVAFGPKEAPYARERIWHKSQAVEDTEDGGLVLRMRVGMSTELVRWVLSFGPECRVLEPESLAAEVRRQHIDAAADWPVPAPSVEAVVAEEPDA